MPIVLTIKENMRIPMLQDKNAFVRFTRDGCTHCESSQDAWDEVCKVLDGEYREKNDAAVLQVESALENALGLTFPDGSPYAVSGYPTYAIFKHGVFEREHDGGRSANELVIKIPEVLKLMKKKNKRKRMRRTRAHGTRTHKRSRRQRHSKRRNRRRSRHRGRKRSRRHSHRRRKTPKEVIDITNFMR